MQIPTDILSTVFKAATVAHTHNDQYTRRSRTHLKDSLVIDLIEHSAIDLIGFKCGPVEHRKTELGFYRLLDADGCVIIVQIQIYINQDHFTQAKMGFVYTRENKSSIF